MDAGIPILRGIHRFQSVELADIFKTPVDQLPGARPVASYLTPVFSGTAAWPVKHMLGTSGYRTYAAVFMQNALAAGDTFLCPGCSLFENADKRRIKTGINRFVKALGNSLNPGAAS